MGDRYTVLYCARTLLSRTVTVSTAEGLHCPVLYTFSKLTPATPILTVRRCAHTVGASVSTVCAVGPERTREKKGLFMQLLI